MNDTARQRLQPWVLPTLFFLGWVLLTFYPRPADLVRSVYRVFRPPVDAAYISAYAHLFADLDDPVEIDRRVSELFPYRYDWVSWNRPWYFPTVDEAFAAMTGDCKTRLLVLASVLEYRGIPYSFSVSPTHVWVEYPGKQENRSENAQVAFFSTDPSGGGNLARPTGVDLRRSLDSFWTAFWRYMPFHKKLSLVVGFMLALAVGIVTTESRTQPCHPTRKRTISGVTAEVATPHRQIPSPAAAPSVRPFSRASDVPTP